jgi:syntaxin-binding protein 1
MSFGERSMRSGASERTAYGVSSSYHHSPRHVVQSPATTRAGRDSSPPRLARAQRTPYYVESSDEEQPYGGPDETRSGVFDTVDRHLGIDDTDRLDSTSSDSDSDSEDEAEELDRFFHGKRGVGWALGELGAMSQRVEALAQQGVVSRDGTKGFRVADEKAIRADARTLPDACKKTTLLGLLRAAEHTKHRKSAKARDVIRREVELRFEEIMESAGKVDEWLQEDAHSFPELMGSMRQAMSGGDDVDATFLEPGPLGITFACDGPGKAAFISSIKHGSPAAHTPGLELKMELTSVDGVKVKKWAFDDVLALITPARPLRLTFAYGSSARIMKAVMPAKFGIVPEEHDGKHTNLRVRYVMWRMVTVKLRAHLGRLVNLLDAQWVKDVFFNSSAKPRAAMAEPGLYPDGEVHREFHEQVVRIAERLDSPKENGMFTKARSMPEKTMPLILSREPNEAPYSGLAKLTRRSLITKLQRVAAFIHDENQEGFKVLIMDAEAKQVVRQFATMDELSHEAGICHVDLISNERHQLEPFDVVYIVAPTSANLNQIMEDFGGEEPKYSHAHVFLTSDHLSRKLLKEFKRELGSHLIGDVQFLRMDFLASEPEFSGYPVGEAGKVSPMPMSGSFFNLDMPDVKADMQSSVDGRSHDPDRTALRRETEAEQDIQKTLRTRHLVAEKLAHVCAQLGELKPAIRWQQAAEEHTELMTPYEKIEASSPTAKRARSHTARTCKEIAEGLHDILSQYAEDRASCGITTVDTKDAEERRRWHAEDTKFQSRGNTCVLIIDRTMDPLAPLLHEGSYESMYEELAMLNKKKFAKDFKSVISTQRYNQLRNLQLHQAVEIVDQKSERFSQDCPRKGTWERRVQEVKRGYPFSQDEAEFKLHREMAGLLLLRFKNRKLEEAYQYEAAMANGKGGSKDLDVEVLAQTLYELPWPDDKARLTLSYLITHRETALLDSFVPELLEAFQIHDLSRVRALLANLSGEDKKQYSYGPHRGGGQDFGGRYTPTVCLLGKDVHDHSLKENLFPYVKASRLAGHPNHRSLKSDKSKQSVTAQLHHPSRRAAKKAQAHSSSQLVGPIKPYSRIILFVIGGVTKSEVAHAERLSKELGAKTEVYIGGTEIIDHTKVLADDRSDSLCSKKPASMKEAGQAVRAANAFGAAGGGRSPTAARTLKDMDDSRSPRYAGSSSSSSDGDDDLDSDEEGQMEPTRTLNGRLTLVPKLAGQLGADAKKRCEKWLRRFVNSETDPQLVLQELEDAVGLSRGEPWPFPFRDDDEDGEGGYSDDSGLLRLWRRLLPDHQQGSPHRAKVPIVRLADQNEIQQAAVVAEAEALLKRYDRGGLGRLTYHQLEACVMRGGQLKRYVDEPSSSDAEQARSRHRSSRSRPAGTLEPVEREELRVLFDQLSDRRGAHPTVDIRKFAMCCRHPAHMPATAPAMPQPEPEPEPEVLSPYSDPASPIAEEDDGYDAHRHGTPMQRGGGGGGGGYGESDLRLSPQGTGRRAFNLSPTNSREQSPLSESDPMERHMGAPMLRWEEWEALGIRQGDGWQEKIDRLELNKMHRLAGGVVGGNGIEHVQHCVEYARARGQNDTAQGRMAGRLEKDQQRCACVAPIRWAGSYICAFA